MQQSSKLSGRETGDPGAVRQHTEKLELNCFVFVNGMAPSRVHPFVTFVYILHGYVNEVYFFLNDLIFIIGTLRTMLVHLISF